MADKIKTAILLFEPRVITDKVELKSDNELDGVVLIEIGYTIITTNTRNNIVFPFYKNEGFKNA